MNYRTVNAWVRKGADEHWPEDVFVTIARDSEELLWTTSADHYRLRQVLMQFDLKGRHVLDVGCGTGLLLCFALKQGAALGIGVDIDPPRLHKAGLRVELKGNGHCCVLQVDIRTTLPFQRSFFDFAIFSNVIEHLRSSDQKLIMQELARVINPGGVVLMCTDNPQALVYRLIEMWHRTDSHSRNPARLEWSPHFHWGELNKEQLLTLVKSAGFRVLRHEFFRLPKLHKLGLSRYRVIRAMGGVLSRVPPQRFLAMSQFVACRRIQ